MLDPSSSPSRFQFSYWPWRSFTRLLIGARGYVPPLRKVKPDGTLYERGPEIEVALDTLVFAVRDLFVGIAIDRSDRGPFVRGRVIDLTPAGARGTTSKNGRFTMKRKASAHPPA